MVLLGQWVRCGCGEHARIRCEEAVVHRSGMAARKDQCVNPKCQPQPPIASHQPPTQADNTDTDTYTYTRPPEADANTHPECVPGVSCAGGDVGITLRFAGRAAPHTARRTRGHKCQLPCL
jgi:hypothetical protein